jgi:tetratricopeptide (TPR) repeat protein
LSGIGPVGSQAALDALARTLAANPGDRVARHNLANELRRLDREAEALGEVERVLGEGLRLGETLALRGYILTGLGRFAEGEAALREALRIKPELVEAAQALAALLPQVGRADEALDGFREALSQSPGTGILWVEAMAAAKAHGAWEQLLEWADASETRFGADTMISVFAANALSGLGRDAEAHDRLTSALAAEPSFASGHTTLAHVAVRLGDYRAAERAALTATELAPLDQSGWALLGAIWRVLGDAREDWLCRYDELVMPVRVELPVDLAASLTMRHRALAHPADQSLRGGTQTPGNLFQTADPAIADFARGLRTVIEQRVGTLPSDSSHPFLGRNTGSIAFSASWSVRLREQGFHISHIHPAGWLSSALYVSLPSEVVAGGGEGVLTFGVPDAALQLDLAPRRTIQPQEGLLVIFPSYLWHNTTPFSSAEARLTVAFDALPIANSRDAA